MASSTMRACRSLRQAQNAAVAARRVGQADDGAGMEVPVRRLVLLVELEAGTDEAVSRLVDVDSEQTGEAGRAQLLQLGERELHRSTLQAGSP